jgi:hypothetical protein
MSDKSNLNIKGMIKTLQSYQETIQKQIGKCEVCGKDKSEGRYVRSQPIELPFDKMSGSMKKMFENLKV